MKTPGVSESHGLTFAWLHRPKISLALPGFLFLSLFFHAVTFYIFQVAYPPPAAVTPPAVQVNVLAPTTPENQELLRWIESENPAATGTPQATTPPMIRDVAYQPSFATVRTTPKTFTEKDSAVAFPAAFDTLELLSGTRKKNADAPAKNVTQQSALKFSGSLASRKISTLPSLHPSPENFANPGSTKFFVGVGRDGRVQYVFLQNSSGSATLDRQAENHLAEVAFARGGKDVTWGFATYSWGDDAYVAAADRSPQPPR